MSRAEIWVGDPVDCNVMLHYIQDILAADRYHRIHYIFAAPFCRRNAEMDCLARLTWIRGGSYRTSAAFDGMMQDRELVAGDITVCGRSGWDRSAGGNENYRVFSIVFHPHHIRLVYADFVEGKIVNNPYYHTSFPVSGIGVRLLEALNEIMQEVDQDRDSRTYPLLRTLLFQLKQDIMRQGQSADHVTDRQVAKLTHYLQQNFHLPINCSTTCEALGLSRSYASTLFHQKTGQTMNSYLCQLRMNEAAGLLIYHDLSIEKVAELCSFTGSSYFIKVFQQFYGVSPGESRRQRRTRKLELPPILSK